MEFDVFELSNLLFHVLAVINATICTKQKVTLSQHDVSCIECLAKLIIYDSSSYKAHSRLIMQNEEEKT